MLSGTEGSCVAVVEALFANVPVGLFEKATIGSKAFINDQTGALLPSRDLGRHLTDFIDRADRMEPRRWVMEHDVSCFGSSHTLNEAIKAKATASGEPWTKDIATHHWRPNPSYVHEEDVTGFATAYIEFKEKYSCSILRRGTDGAPLLNK